MARNNNSFVLTSRNERIEVNISPFRGGEYVMNIVYRDVSGSRSAHNTEVLLTEEVYNSIKSEKSERGKAVLMSNYINNGNTFTNAHSVGNIQARLNRYIEEFDGKTYAQKEHSQHYINPSSIDFDASSETKKSAPHHTSEPERAIRKDNGNLLLGHDSPNSQAFYNAKRALTDKNQNNNLKAANSLADTLGFEIKNSGGNISEAEARNIAQIAEKASDFKRGLLGMGKQAENELTTREIGQIKKAIEDALKPDSDIETRNQRAVEPNKLSRSDRAIHRTNFPGKN